MKVDFVAFEAIKAGPPCVLYGLPG
jgi:hypothetical protein